MAKMQKVRPKTRKSAYSVRELVEDTEVPVAIKPSDISLAVWNLSSVGIGRLIAALEEEVRETHPGARVSSQSSAACAHFSATGISPSELRWPAYDALKSWGVRVTLSPVGG